MSYKANTALLGTAVLVVFTTGVAWAREASQAPTENLIYGVSIGEPTAPSLTATLRSGETISIQRSCGHIAAVKVVDPQGRVLFSIQDDLTDSHPRCN